MKCDLFAFGKRTFSQNVTDFNDFLLNFARFYKVFNWRKTFFIRFQYSSQLALKRWFIEILLFKKPSNGNTSLIKSWYISNYTFCLSKEFLREVSWGGKKRNCVGINFWSILSPTRHCKKSPWLRREKARRKSASVWSVRFNFLFICLYLWRKWRRNLLTPTLWYLISVVSQQYNGGDGTI